MAPGDHKEPPDPHESYAFKAKGGMTDRVRLYADIIMKQKKERTMIEIKFSKRRNDEESGRIN